MNGFKNQRNKRFNRNLRYNRRRRGNYYFRNHKEQSGYNKLVTNKTTLKKIINADIPIYVINGRFSFSQTTEDTTAYADYFTGDEFKDCAKIYQQFRVIGLRFNIYRVGQPVLLTKQNTNHEWGLLGIRTNITQSSQLPDDTQASDNTYWVSYLGEWMTYSKFTSFKTRVGSNNMIEWSPVTVQTKQVHMTITTKGNVSVPDGYKIYLLSMQYMIEFSNPN